MASRRPNCPTAPESPPPTGSARPLSRAFSPPAPAMSPPRSPTGVRSPSRRWDETIALPTELAPVRARVTAAEGTRPARPARPPTTAPSPGQAAVDGRRRSECLRSPRKTDRLQASQQSSEAAHTSTRSRSCGRCNRRRGPSRLPCFQTQRCIRRAPLTDPQCAQNRVSLAIRPAEGVRLVGRGWGVLAPTGRNASADAKAAGVGVGGTTAGLPLKQPRAGLAISCLLCREAVA